jgi:hypothetical protein
MQQLSDRDIHADSAGNIDRRHAVGIRPMLWAAALCALFTAPVAWNARQAISNDGISYLEVAANTLRLGPVHLLSNAYWSPAYPALLALALKIAQPTLASELALVHSVDWAICAFEYLCFTYFLWNLLRWIQLKHPGVVANQAGFRAILAFAYTLLFVSNLDITLWFVGPNVLMAALVYLAAAICVRLSLPDTRIIHFIALGLVLAFGYAVKAALFPLSLILIGILFLRPLTRDGFRRGLVATSVAFIVGASPLIAVLSYAKGRLTFGDSGNLAYAWYVNSVPRSILWEGNLPGSAALVHPARRIWASPPILKFDGPGRAESTYAYWYDPSWWYDGVKSHFDLRQQAQQFLRALGRAPKIMISGMTVLQLAERWLPIWAGLAALVLVGARVRTLRVALRGHMWLFLWPASATILFAAVLLDYRYLFPFIVLAWTALFAAAWIVTGPERFAAVALTVTAGLLLAYCPDTARQILQNFQHPPTSNLVVAKRMAALGIRPGDELASADFASYSYFARLAGARFTMQMLREDLAVPPKLPQEEIQKLPQPEVQALIETLRANGARALVSMWRPAFDNDSGWVLLTKNIYIRPIQ